MSDSYYNIARILRINPDHLKSLDSSMREITGKSGVIDAIDADNHEKIDRALQEMHITDRKAEIIYEALIQRLGEADAELFQRLGKPQLEQPETVTPLIRTGYELAQPNKGLFLKHAKATDMLRQCPPPNIMKALGYSNVDEMLAKEKLIEVYSALRFMESREWMNVTFLKTYETLSPNDFEERDIETIVLPMRWLEIGERFAGKKYHNLSHLKELGVIFIIPIKIDSPGELSTVLTLLLHYLNEVQFYSKLILSYAKNAVTFSQKLISFIRGDVGEAGMADANAHVRWLIVQRYLSKDDPVDPRLFTHHVNPEAIHWKKATEQVTALGLGLWKDLDYVGNFFPNVEGGGDLLVSFDLIDNIMTLVKKTQIKYLYHQQEALWNRIYTGYMGEEGFEDMILANLDKGYLEILT